MNERFSFAIGMRLVVRLLGFVSLFFVARYMGAEVLGTLAFATAYIQLFQQFSDLGFGTAHVKRVSEGKDLGICNGTYFSVKAILTVLMVIIVVLSLIIPKYVTGAGNFSTEQEIIIYIFLFAVILENISAMFNTTFSARKEIAKLSIGELVNKVVTVAFKLIVIFSGLGIFWLAGASVLGALVWTILLLYFFRGYPIKKPNKEYFKSYFKYAIPVIFIGFLSKYAENIDKVMIGYFSNSSDVGFYTAGQSFARIFILFMVSSNSLVFPTISKLHSENNFSDIRKLSNKVEKYFSLLMLPIIIIITVFSEAITFHIFGTEFLDITPSIISISMWAIFITATMNPYSAQLGATNRIRLAAKVSVFYLSISILLNVLFIPDQIFNIKTLGLGAVGASWATLIAAIIASVTYRYHAFRISGSKPSSSILKHLLAGVFMFLLLQFLRDQFTNNMEFLFPILFSVLGVLIYFAFLYFIKEFTIVEIGYLRSFINLNRISSYAKDEIKGKKQK